MSRKSGPLVRRAAAMAALLVLAACAANPYAQFYKDLSARRAEAYDRFAGEPTISYSSKKPIEDVERMFGQGYGQSGIANFVGPSQSRELVVAQARKVGASHVLMYSAEGRSAAGRYQQVAYFFRPLLRHGFGILFQPLNDKEKQRVQTNEGIIVLAVRKGSPAFIADILPGDIVLSLGGRPVYDAATTQDAIRKATGREVAIVLNRQGRSLTKEVTIPAGTW